MKLYPKLALAGIRKNKRLYVPYLLTCVGMVMMFYIVHSLSYSPLLQEMRGGITMESILSLGKFVIAVFGLIFLVYTNSFLVRRRNKEFGLYHILGMEKRGLGHIMAWESLFVAVIGLAGGLLLGIAFSKFAELGLMNMLREKVDYRFTVSPEAIGFTVLIFGGIFGLLFLKSVLQVLRTKPLELMHSENLGEKAPKGNWLLAILGLGMLGTAYYMAVTIQSPIKVLTLFFVAVILVILATYCLFTAGSVTLCRILQKNKGYYYKKAHFVSVSSMRYRMKRNGAGLASICILATMVLVTLTSTSSLYTGEEDMVEDLYPTDYGTTVFLQNVEELTGEPLKTLDARFYQALEENGVVPQKVERYRYAEITGLLTGDQLEPDPYVVSDDDMELDNVRQVLFMDVKEYNAEMGTDYRLRQGQAILATRGCTYHRPSLSIRELTLNVVKNDAQILIPANYRVYVVPVFLVLVSDLQELAPLSGLIDDVGVPMLNCRWFFGMDSDGDQDTVTRVMGLQREEISAVIGDHCGYSFFNRYQARQDFYTSYGGLFFLGILLSLVFLAAAVLIIYYKQISEGYEDRARFEIMQKVGMTARDIRKSINSQMLTVFFAPLLMAGLHLCFAFPLVWKCLQLFGMTNMTVAVVTNLGAFGIFAIFYALVYKATAHSYYKIVCAE